MGTPDINDLNTLLSELENNNFCDTACQKRNHIDTREKELRNAITQYNERTNKIKKAERNYFNALKGASEYNDYLKKRHDNQADNILAQKTKEKDKILNEIEKKNNYLNSQKIYNTHIGVISSNYDDKKQKLNKELKDTINDKNISNRLAFFYSEKMNYLSNINTIFFYVYFIVLAMIAVIAIYKKQYGSLKLLAYIVFLIITPFLLDDYYYFILKLFKHTVVDNIYIILFIFFIILTCLLNWFANFVFKE